MDDLIKYTELRHQVLTALIRAGHGALRRDRGLGNYSVGYYPDEKKLSRRWVEGAALRTLHQFYKAGVIEVPDYDGFGVVRVSGRAELLKKDWDLVHGRAGKS